MKKSLPFVLVFFIGVALSSCTSNFIHLFGGKRIDTRLVGLWYGSEKDQQTEGVTKHWEIQRNKDGTFVLNFSINQDGDTKTQRETGKWWIEKGKYYEVHKESEMTDVYTYEVLTEDQIKFKSDFISEQMNTDSYEFIDYRKK